jgi:hypothetical protein
MIVFTVDIASASAIEDHMGYPLRVGCGEQCGHGRALGKTEQRGALDASCLHHRVKIIHPLVKRWGPGNPV